MNHVKLSVLALAATGLLAAGSAFAQSRTYNFNDRDLSSTAPTGGCNVGSATSGGFSASYGNVVGCRETGNTGSATLNVTAWHNDSTTVVGGYRTAAMNDQGGNGFGIFNQTEGLAAPVPNHAADNLGTSSDLFLLSFTSAQALRSVTIGWAGDDGDFQVLRWGGSGAATAIANRTAAQLLTDGWVLMSTGVGSDTVFNGVGAAGGNDTNQTFNFNSTGIASTAWLISAYNSAWAGTGATHIGAGDAIKVLGITTTSTGVSAPGTLALAGLGLLGAAFLRRRNA